jgi:hypothetical protein
MVAFVPGLSNRVISPGSPAPISFGMGKDPSQSMSLTPGGGNPGTDIFGANLSDGWTPSPGAPPAASPQGSSSAGQQSATNLAPVNVNAGVLNIPPLTYNDPFGTSGAGSGGSPAQGESLPLHVTNLAPVKVQAQMPVQPGWFDQWNMFEHDHPYLSGLAESAASAAIPWLKPVLVGAHAYYNAQHGQPLLGNLWGKITGGLASLGDGPGSPLSNSPNTPLFSDLYGQPASGSGADTSYGIGSGLSGSPSIAASGSLPYYPGLSALSGGSAPIGGFWNQQALRDAAPAYGPYAGFAQGAAPNPNPYGLPPALAPTGIRGS